MKQIGRNQPCWCGSQKKYKHCHLKLDQEESLAKPIISRSAEYIEGMVQANILAKKTIQMLERFIQSETTTNKLNNLAHQFILDHGGMPASLNYQGFPKSICTSLNEVVCHGIPNDEPIKEGDIIGVDVACVLNDYYGDICKTFPVKSCSEKATKLIQVTEECLEKAIQATKPYGKIGDIGSAIQKCVEKNGFSVVEQFIGHGIGKHFHEKLEIPHFGKAGQGEMILPGMFFTIEPMINEGSKGVKILEDNWTAVTVDNKLSAQFEHTLQITESEVRVLTR